MNNKSPNQLEEMMQVVSIKAWIALGSILVLLGSVTIWAFFGSLHQTVEVSGVLVRSGRTISIYAYEDSFILDLAVTPGQFVEQDQVIARVDQTELVRQVNLAITEQAGEDTIAILRNELISRSQITAGESGRILEVYVRPGDYVQTGDKIASLSVGAREDKSLECLLFVPVSQLQGIRKGMNVSVYPDFADKEEYGNMIGTVAFISEYPVTRQYLYDILGSDELAAAFYGDTACYEVTVNLVPSEDTRTGYQWSTSLGPAQEINNLSLCEAAVLTDNLRPVDVFFSQD